jgi:putative ABC transport system substrate-binding protein
MAPSERPADRGAARANTGLSRRVFVQRLAGLGAATVLATCAGQPVTPSPSPTPKLRRIGYLSGNASAPALNYAAVFRDELRQLGYVEGRDIEIVPRIAENDAKRLPAMAAELVALPVDVLIAEARDAQLAARDATKSIPIVIILTSNPVGAGLVTSLSHPGGNITGVITGTQQSAPKMVELLKETVLGLARIGIVWNANIPNMRTEAVKATEDAARTLRVETRVFGVHDPGELDAAVETMAQEHLDGLVMLTGLSIIRDHGQVPDIAAKYRLPQIFADIEIVRAGGLMHFGANFKKMIGKAAVLVDKILRGEDPGELPIEQPTDFDFIVNRTMERRLGLTIPASVIRRATEVIP